MEKAIQKPIDSLMAAIREYRLIAAHTRFVPSQKLVSHTKVTIAGMGERIEHNLAELIVALNKYNY